MQGQYSQTDLIWDADWSAKTGLSADRSTGCPTRAHSRSGSPTGTPSSNTSTPSGHDRRGTRPHGEARRARREAAAAASPHTCSAISVATEVKSTGCVEPRACPPYPPPRPSLGHPSARPSPTRQSSRLIPFRASILPMAHPFAPSDFVVPIAFEGNGFRLEPFGSQRNERGHAAWMASIEHIHFTPGLRVFELS